MLDCRMDVVWQGAAAPATAATPPGRTTWAIALPATVASNA